MFKKILAAIAFLLLILVVVVAFQPAEFRITRTAKMAASPDAVFKEVNDFHHWAEWSPWEKLDPAMKKTFEGAPAGTGAVYTWSGNRQAGRGRMEVTESRPDELVKMKLDFLEPFEARDNTEFTFKPEGGQTVVTWTMTGTNNFMSKAMFLFMNMDKMVGGDFEKGLAQLETAAKAAPAP